MAEKTKHYRIAERSEDAAENGYDRPLPLEIAQADGVSHPIPFYVSDALGTETGRSRRVVLRMLVSEPAVGIAHNPKPGDTCPQCDHRLCEQADSLAVSLNGSSLSAEPVTREHPNHAGTRYLDSYAGQRLEFILQDVRALKAHTQPSH